MATKRAGFPRWLYFLLGLGALLASGIFLGIARTDGFTAGRLIRIVLFGLLGILWVFLYGAADHGRPLAENPHEDDRPDDPASRRPDMPRERDETT